MTDEDEVVDVQALIVSQEKERAQLQDSLATALKRASTAEREAAESDADARLQLARHDRLKRDAAAMVAQVRHCTTLSAALVKVSLFASRNGLEVTLDMNVAASE